MAKHQAARADVMQGGGRARHRLAGEGVSSARGVNIELKAVECIDVINIFFRSGLRSLNLDVGI